MQTLLDFQNRAIRLSDERQQHILEHPEMEGLEAEIRRTLSKPEIVRRSKSDVTVILYYRYYTDTLVGEKWLCVVVKLLLDDAFVLTAYLTDKPKQGESLL
ncbi:MAG: hypothetical protein KME43_12805 [Myxacorys chilensis ATA2-1-KO14]|jgi:hypothetical protein|nr:hypothetical protein [Myxacorys chilensis ATA2-1-KO14]